MSITQEYDRGRDADYFMPEFDRAKRLIREGRTDQAIEIAEALREYGFHDAFATLMEKVNDKKLQEMKDPLLV